MMGAGSGCGLRARPARVEVDALVELVQGEAHSGARQNDFFALASLALGSGTPVAFDDRGLGAAVGYEEHRGEARELIVVRELLSAVVVPGRVAGHLDQESRIGDGKSLGTLLLNCQTRSLLVRG